MPQHIKARKVAFMRSMRRNFQGIQRHRVLDGVAFKFIIGSKPLCTVMQRKVA